MKIKLGKEIVRARSIAFLFFLNNNMHFMFNFQQQYAFQVTQKILDRTFWSPENPGKMGGIPFSVSGSEMPFFALHIFA